MKKIFFFVCFLSAFFSFAQTKDRNEKPSDSTILLKEISVFATFPLANQDIADFYRQNHFSTMDGVNARLDGMALIRRGAYAMEPQLHGFSGGQINLTIDGMRMFGACTDKMDPITSYLEPTNLKSITIRQGTNACHTGANIGGSVDMVLQEPDFVLKKKWNIYGGFGYETASRSPNILFGTSYSLRKWAWALNGVHRNAENYRDGNGRIVPFSQFTKTNVHSALRFMPDSLHHFKLDFLFDYAQNVGYPALPMDVGIAKASLMALEYKYFGKTSLKAKIYANQIIHFMDDSKRDSLYFLKNSSKPTPDSVFMRMDMPGISSTFGTYLHLNRRWGKKNELIAKIDHYTNIFLAEMTMYMRYPQRPPETPMYLQTLPHLARNVTGIFFQNTTFISPKFSIILNGRLDRSLDILQSDDGQNQFSIFAYSLSKKQENWIKSLNLEANYELNSAFSLGFSMGYAERLPTTNERLGFYLYNAYDGYDYIGNPYLRTEKSKQARLTAQFANSKLKINFSQSFSFLTDYLMGITDRNIPPMNFYARGTRSYQNMPKAEMHSTDLQISYQASKNWTIFEISKFTYARITTNEAMPLIPPLKNFLAIKYQKKAFSWQIECENAFAQNRINADYGEQKTPSFTIFHFKSGYVFHFSKTRVQLSFNVSNLLNRAYFEHLDWGRIYRAGRSFELFAKVSI